MLTRILFRQIGASSSIRLITSCRVLHKKRTPRAENAPIAHKLNSKQSFIVQHAKDYNLCVSAVPGSGKTTVAVAIMEGDPYRKTLIVTYSKLLQMETLDKATKRGLGRNSPIFTIHALAGKLAGETIMDDKTLESFLRRIESAPFTPKYRLDFDQIIVDEAQDLRLPHYRFTVALYNMVKEATRKSPRLIVMGDPKQAIYDYDGGDSRYLTHADTILKDVTPYKWKRVEMTETHRFGVPSAEFVNIQSDPRTVILGSLVGSQKRPIFMFVDNIYHSQRIAKALADMITQYRPHQTAILAPTQRADTPIAKLANTLALKYRIPISGLPDDDAELTVKTMRGKLVMSTYHKFKGRERDLVIVLGANGDWFHRYGISHPDDTLSNEHFVAFTRHKEQLVVIHDKRQPLLPNLTLDILRSTCEIVNLGNTPLSIPPYTPRTPEIQLRIPERVSVTDFLKHLSSEVVVNAAECYLQVHVLKTALPEHEHIKIPSEVATRKVGKIRHYEPVSDLTGVAITAAFEYEVTGECRTFRFVGDISDVPLDPDPRSIWFAKTARDHYCKTNNFPPRKLQLPDRYCIWLKGYLDVTNQRLLDYTEGGTELAFEQFVRGSVKVDGKTLVLVGTADIIQGEIHPIIHEIKFIFSPSTEDIMQVALYGYLWACQNRQSEIPELRVFNVRTGEVIKVESTLEKMESLIRDIARWKYSAKSKLNDEDFIARCDDELKKMSGITLYNSVDSDST